MTNVNLRYGKINGSSLYEDRNLIKRFNDISNEAIIQTMSSLDEGVQLSFEQYTKCLKYDSDKLFDQKESNDGQKPSKITESIQNLNNIRSKPFDTNKCFGKDSDFYGMIAFRGLSLAEENQM